MRSAAVGATDTVLQAFDLLELNGRIFGRRQAKKRSWQGAGAHQRRDRLNECQPRSEFALKPAV